MYVIIYDSSQYYPIAMVSVQQNTQKPSRVERKRQETRARIMAEAERLMREHPVDEVTIGDITEAADVGHGTFYLHFKSKYEVLVPIIKNYAEEIDRLIQATVQGFDDPAEVMAFSGRHMARSIIADPLWRWFLQHSGVPVEDMREVIGRFSGRDFGKGLLSGRF
jgi:AcrR family transcriptional regulator